VADNTELPNAFVIIGGLKIFPITGSVTKIGRAFDNDLILEYPQISRKHAELRFSQGHFEIVDMDSTGGTFVNGIKIDKQVLYQGDVITLVNLHLVFGQDEKPDPTQATEYIKPQHTKQAEQDTKTFPPESAENLENEEGTKK